MSKRKKVASLSADMIRLKRVRIPGPDGTTHEAWAILDGGRGLVFDDSNLLAKKGKAKPSV